LPGESVIPRYPYSSEVLTPNKLWSSSVPGGGKKRTRRLTASPCNLETISAKSGFVFHRSNCSIPTTSVTHQAHNRHRITPAAAHNTENQRVTASGGGRNGRDNSSTVDR
jgi:hypothetical protein